MRFFWNDSGRGIPAHAPEPCTLEQALNTWSDDIRANKGNFLGLVDARDNTMQFYFNAPIPDHVEDASHLAIVRLDFPVPAQRGSYGLEVSIGRVHELIEQAFAANEIDHRRFETTFKPW